MRFSRADLISTQVRNSFNLSGRKMLHMPQKCQDNTVDKFLKFREKLVISIVTIINRRAMGILTYGNRGFEMYNTPLPPPTEILSSFD